MWAEHFGAEFAIENDCLIIKGTMLGGETYFCIISPACRYDKEIFDKLKSFSLKNYGYFILFPVEEGEIELYKNLCGGFEATANEDWFDYVYLIDDLVELKGKKFHGQKNYVNRFKRENPDAEFKPIDSQNLHLVTAFLQEYKKGFCQNGNASGILNYEIDKNNYILNNLHTVNVVAMALFVGGAAVGFTVGSLINDTLIVHIEKACKSVRGAYQYLNNSFAAFVKNNYEGIKYINREEDLGETNLRVAKESYHPVFKLKKFKLKWII
jgi:hypothetical protein